MVVKAVIFDIGGVVVSSPLAGISTFERANNIPDKYINVAIANMGEQGAWERLERGEISLPEFYPLFGAELSDSRNIESYCKFLRSKSCAVPSFSPLKIDGESLFASMMAVCVPNSQMVHAIRQLRQASLKIGALTNNWVTSDNGSTLPHVLRNLFDDVVESAKVNLRKPDPKIFLLACERLDVRPDQTVFLDDLGVNLKAAGKLGIRPIRVWIGKEVEAIKELESITGLQLLPGSNL